MYRMYRSAFGVCRERQDAAVRRLGSDELQDIL